MGFGSEDFKSGHEQLEMNSGRNVHRNELRRPRRNEERGQLLGKSARAVMNSTLSGRIADPRTRVRSLNGNHRGIERTGADLVAVPRGDRGRSAL